jgi:hypothetical protein
MPTGNLESVSLLAPGFLGLNTQDSQVGLSSGYATQADNIVIDKGGRMTSRKGHKLLNEPIASLGDNYIESIWRHDLIDGRTFYLANGNNKMYKGEEAGVRSFNSKANTRNFLSALVDITPANVAIDGNRWQMQTLPEGAGSNATIWTIATQKDNPALAFSVNGLTTEWVEIADKPLGVTNFDPDACLSAYGRIWTAGISENPFTIFYSDLLDPTNFNSNNAGILDISSVVGNNDTIVGLAQHNNFLVIFCQDNIVIYKGAENPDTMSLEDVITGVGCLSRDSIKATGTDLIFMSKSGVRSFTRTVQEKSMPMRELTLNIRDEMAGWLDYETNPQNIRAGYCEDEAFYVITLPLNRKIVYLDLRMPLENGSARTTTWSLSNGELFSCYFDDRDKYDLMMGVKGGVAQYTGLQDRDTTFDLVYRSASSDLGGQGQIVYKLAKRATLTLEGAKQQDFVLKYGYDYTRNPRKVVVDRDLGTGIYPKYSDPTSLYGVSKYSSVGIGIHRVKIPLGGSGESFFFGLDATIRDELISVQKIDIFLKTGKRS